MTFAEVNTPFEKHRTIVYKANGVDITYKNIEMQHAGGNLYLGRTKDDGYGGLCCDVYAYFQDADIAIVYAKMVSRPHQRDVDVWVSDTVRLGYDSTDSIERSLDDSVGKGSFIPNHMIELSKYICPAKTERYKAARLAFYARKEEEQRLREEQERIREQEEEERRIAEKRAEKEKLLGWADNMTDLRFGKVMSTLETPIRWNGKIMAKYQFIIEAVTGGMNPVKKDGIVTYYGNKWNPKQSKAKTEYRLYDGDIEFYKITKTEYDFAVYLKEKAA